MSLLSLTLALTLGAAPLRVFIDPGHGVDDNLGTPLADCRREAEATLEIGGDLARRLGKNRRLHTQLSRTATPGPSYPERRDAAEAGRADVFLSLHIDSRAYDGAVDGKGCTVTEGHEGFSVLYSDEGTPAQAAGRRMLARAIATALAKAGFTAYDGAVYQNYALDAVPGVFIDRRGLFVLRRPKMPSVIIETHHGQNAAEHARWALPETRAAFAAAVEAALGAFAPGPNARAKPTVTRRRGAAASPAATSGGEERQRGGSKRPGG